MIDLLIRSEIYNLIEIRETITSILSMVKILNLNMKRSNNAAIHLAEIPRMGIDA